MSIPQGETLHVCSFTQADRWRTGVVCFQRTLQALLCLFVKIESKVILKFLLGSTRILLSLCFVVVVKIENYCMKILKAQNCLCSIHFFVFAYDNAIQHFVLEFSSLNIPKATMKKSALECDLIDFVPCFSHVAAVSTMILFQFLRSFRETYNDCVCAYRGVAETLKF